MTRKTAVRVAITLLVLAILVRLAFPYADWGGLFQYYFGVPWYFITGNSTLP